MFMGKIINTPQFQFLKNQFTRLAQGKVSIDSCTGNFTEVNPLRRIATQTSSFVTRFEFA